MKQQNLPVLYQVPATPIVMKNILIADAATGSHMQVTIHPGTTAGQVLSQAGFNQDFVLTRNRDGESIPMDENLYESVPDGAKVWASTPVDFGRDYLSDLDTGDEPEQLPEYYVPPFKYYSPPFAKVSVPPIKSPAPIIDVRVATSRPAARRVIRHIEVKPAQLPYWQEKGWTRSRDTFTTVYVGYFHSPRHKVRGEIDENVFSCKISVHNPPEHVLRHHPTWGCFHRRANGWWEIHHHGCPNASSAIVQVERTLNEAEELDHENLY
jgi:hypothetical protein